MQRQAAPGSKPMGRPVRMASGDSPPGFFPGTRCALRLFEDDWPAYSAFDPAKFGTGNNPSQTGITKFQSG